MKVLVINGSHRKGNTDIAISKLTEIMGPKVEEFRVLVLRNIEIRLPDGCEACAESKICPNVKDEFSEKIEPTIRDYDVYVIATPTWSDAITPLSKIFWDRIVSWCGEGRKYLKGKKLALITHGMADESSWENVVNWVRSICEWEECKFVGSLTFRSDSKIGDIKLSEIKVKEFVERVLES